MYSGKGEARYNYPGCIIMIPMKIKGLGLDSSHNPLLLLVDEEETMVLPLILGLGEAQLISIRLEDYLLPRPLTHDLLFSICSCLGGSIKRIVMNDAGQESGVYCAQIYLEKNGEGIIIDSSPSDGIVLSLVSGCPLFISKSIAAHTFPFEELIQEDAEIISEEEEDDHTLH